MTTSAELTGIDGSVPVIIAVASVPTDKPARYAKQLVSHLGRKLPFMWSDGIASAPIAAGTRTGRRSSASAG